MRICHVLETAGGGSGQVVLALARYGLECGDDVTVIYAPDRAEAAFVASLKALPLIHILTSPMQRKIGLHDIGDGWRLWQVLLKAGPFDIIHGHSSKAGALTRLVGLFLPGTVVYTPHAFYSMGPDAPVFYGVTERILSWLTPCVICVSKVEYWHGLKLGIKKSKLFIIPNGLAINSNVSREQARLKLQIDDACTLIGFVGRMEAQKNPLRAIAAFAEVSPSHPKVRLVMVGDGSLLAKVEAERACLNPRSSIDLLGFCDARTVISAFDGLLCSSDFEAMPMIFIEALEAGIPIITTPIGGADEAVIEGVTGFISHTPTTHDLAEALAGFLNLSAEQRKVMEGNARHHARSFTLQSMGSKYRTLYSKFSRH